MLDVLLPLTFLLLSWGIGQALYKYLLKSAHVSHFLAPILGTSVLIIISSYLYQLGLQTFQIGLVIYVFSAIALSKLLYSTRSKFSTSIFSVLLLKNYRVVVILVTGYLLLVLPAIVGGVNFKIFQGNHWDSLSYMGITQSITLHTFSELTSDPNIALRDPVATLATSSMRARPNVEILLASLLAPFKLSILDYSYSFALYLTLVLGCAMWAFFIYFKPKTAVTRSIMTIFLIVCFLAGFWGQYFIDINAWSAAVAIPLMFGVFIAQSEWLVKVDLKRGIVLATFLASSILVYPESFLFFSPLIFLFSIFTWWRREVKILRSLCWTILLYCLVFSFLLISKYNPLKFGFSQLKFGSGDASAPWGPYFQAYLGGDQGLSYSSGINFVRTIPSGLMGVYFLSPTELAVNNPRHILAFMVNCLVVFLFVLLLVKLVKFARTSPVGAMTLFGMSFVPILILVSTLWTAGKAINYIIPFAFITTLVAITSKNSGSRSTKFLTSTLLITWGISQIGFAVMRIQTVDHDYSPHSFPPYVSVQNANLKTQQNWIFPVMKERSGCTVIELNINDPFQRYYAQMRLNESRIDWYDKNPINAYFGSGVDIGTMKPVLSRSICVLQNSMNKQKSSYEFILAPKD